MLSVDRQQPPPKLKTSMVGPLGDAVDTPTSAATEVEDVDSGPPVGVLSVDQQQPPPKLKTSMAGPPTSISICSELCKKMLAVTSDPEGCWPRAPVIYDDPHAPLINTCLGNLVQH
jgi:hypothetical protein